MTTDRSRRRRRALLGAIFVVVGVLISALTLGNAHATVTATEPAVEIGESRSIERPEPTLATDTQAAVAVAGVAIARPAPLAPDRGGTNPLPLFIGLAVEAAMIASLWRRSRRTVA